MAGTSNGRDPQDAEDRPARESAWQTRIPPETSDPAPAQNVATAEAGGARRLSDLGQEIGAAGAATAQATVGDARPGSGSVVFPAFDAHHPPEMELIDDCVHCGFCLPTCPTYVLFGEEMDSPRGRVYLMREAHEGEPLNDTMVRHWDLCLGCLACVTACPSGVQYEKLIASTRQQVERRYRRSFQDRFFRELIYTFFPYPARLRAMVTPLALYQRGIRDVVKRSGVLDLLPARLQMMEELTPEIPLRPERIPAWTPARVPAGYPRQRVAVGVLLGCVQRVFFPHVNAATVRVLSAEGCGVAAPKGQGCCGALSEHVGREEEALSFARKTIDVFETAAVDKVIVNVAGCGSMMKEYGYLLRDDPAYADRARRFSDKVRDVSEFLQELGPAAERHPLPMSVVYHDACHLAHGQQIRKQPRESLQQIPGLELKEVPREREICCGSAGTYNLLEPGPGRELGERKARNVLDAQAQLLVTANPGCHLQIQSSLKRLGETMPMAHVVELIDGSIRGLPVDSLLEPLTPSPSPSRGEGSR